MFQCKRKREFVARLICAICFVVIVAPTLIAQDDSPTVGKAGTISELILPGSELVAKPLMQDSPMVVRIVKSIPHGDSFRYEIRFHGLEPGKFNLADWLIRVDGTSTDDLPEIPVEIKSLLPPGQIEPNDLEAGWLPRLGGYRNVMIAAIVLWSLGLLALIFAGRKKADPVKQAQAERTLAELLEERLAAAVENKMPKEKFAELERMLFGFWRRRLGLESESATDALRKIQEHKDAGPLMMQLEQWIHNPKADRQIDLAKLLTPFRNLPADTAEFDS